MEPPNKGQLGTRHFVPCLEVVLSYPFFTFIVFNMQVQTMVKCKMIIVMIPLINLVVVESEGLPHLAIWTFGMHK